MRDLTESEEEALIEEIAEKVGQVAVEVYLENGAGGDYDLTSEILKILKPILAKSRGLK